MSLDREDRERLHDVTVAGNTAAGTVGLGFGASKLRDSYREQHPQQFDRHVSNLANRALKHGASSNTISRGVRLAQKSKPGFKSLVAAGAAASVATGARRLSEHDSRVKRRREALGQPVSKAFGVEIEKFVPPTAKQRKDLKLRAGQALHPPEPKLRSVESSALSSVGYQRQTRRLDVTFNGRPDRRYSYRMKPKQAEQLLGADSKGRHYARSVKGKYPDGRRVRLSDRARLFADPVQKAAFGVLL